MQTSTHTAKWSEPIATIRNISSTGEVLITWNVNLKIPYLNSTHRSLQNRFLECGNSSLDVLVKGASGSKFSALRNLSFTQYVSKFEKNRTTIQLNFDNPADISTEVIPDIIYIKFLNQSCYTST